MLESEDTLFLELAWKEGRLKVISTNQCIHPLPESEGGAALCFPTRISGSCGWHVLCFPWLSQTRCLVQTEKKPALASGSPHAFPECQIIPGISSLSGGIMRSQTSVGTEAWTRITSMSVLRASSFPDSPVLGGGGKVNTARVGSLGVLYTDPILMRLLRPREGL